MSQTDLTKRSLEFPNSAKITGFFANFADPSELQGNFLYYLYLFIFFLDANLLSDHSMMQVVGDGLCNDLLLSVYDELGMPLSKPFTLGFTTPTVSLGFFMIYSILFSILVVEICRG